MAFSFAFRIGNRAVSFNIGFPSLHTIHSFAQELPFKVRLDWPGPCIRWNMLLWESEGRLTESFLATFHPEWFCSSCNTPANQAQQREKSQIKTLSCRYCAEVRVRLTMSPKSVFQCLSYSPKNILWNGGDPRVKATIRGRQGAAPLGSTSSSRTGCAPVRGHVCARRGRGSDRKVFC